MIKLAYEDGGLQVRLQGMQEGLKDLSPVWQGPVHDIFKTMMKAQFDTQGQYTDEEQWVPLSPAYAAWKARHYAGQPILQLRGMLRGSLIQEGPGSSSHVFRSGPSWAEYGTSINYAATHHFGDPSRNIPQRRVIPRMSKAEGKNIGYAILAFILGKGRLVR